MLSYPYYRSSMVLESDIVKSSTIVVKANSSTISTKVFTKIAKKQGEYIIMHIKSSTWLYIYSCL